ncbi:type II toxin-antitoxin system CcdA family antitoxin [Skermanella mucosa]|uniref:type II toxin-antitoxin system CcdA family antitoxin n=1 Tax=Skermanella mucosa TaxID=1789672 RepID=UPI00192C3B41|nr:type II toxin-antitoxin system CcdA family antitoxin [Skermanella mucosa]UEM18719.1 type II toxin-antitoxin system CcdA family antitoxin [Skermanella mucosa]
MRKTTNVSARAELVAEAKSLGIDLSEVFEEALENAVAAARRKCWIAENRQAFGDYDRFVEAHGNFNAGRRLF